MTAFTPSGVEYLTPDDDFDPTGVALAESLDGRLIVPVANTTDRNAKATAFGPTSQKRFYSDRADAGTGRELEVTSNGTTFRLIPSIGAYVPCTYAAGWTTDSGAPLAVRFEGDMVVMRSGRVKRSAADLAVNAGTLYTVASLPSSAYYPPAGTGNIIGLVGAHLSSPAPSIGEVAVLTTGEIQIRWGSSGTVSAATAAGQTIGYLTWPRT